MSFWDKVKEFVGVEEDYIDDDFYDDYDDDRYYDNEDDFEDLDGIDKNTSYDDAAKEINSEASDLGADTYSSNYKQENNFSNDYKKEETKTSEVRKRREDRSFTKNTALTNVRDSKESKMRVTIREPLNYEDGKLVLDDIMDGRSVVLNLEMLEVDKKTQIFYFVSGGLYSLNGTIQNVTKDIYVLAPQGIEIDSATKEGLAGKNLYQI